MHTVQEPFQVQQIELVLWINIGLIQTTSDKDVFLTKTKKCSVQDAENVIENSGFYRKSS